MEALKEVFNLSSFWFIIYSLVAYLLKMILRPIKHVIKELNMENHWL